ncbi:hypothetical protein [Alcaligenes aquatilis]|uniref:hypothetical protein n=1 Tax=Alcaligenes aquatilis TaxID=323284 RepID=UPI003872DD4C
MSKSVVDKGPWHHGVTQDGKRHFVQSEDFRHDTRLYIDGDFAGTNDKERYAKGIATQLNAAPVAAQPDLTQQTLDDVMAGIPARDAEIEALRKQVETLQAQLQSPVNVHSNMCRGIIAPITFDMLAHVLGDGAEQEWIAAQAQPLDIRPLEITDGMALAFHHAITDGSIGQQDVDEIKTGLRAAFVNVVDSLSRRDQAQPPVSGADGLADYPTHGMSLGQRIAYVGGRENAQGYVEFGSPMAVHALIQHVLRDFHRQGRVCLAPAQQEADKVDAALAGMVHAMFRSGNSVPVTRITIDRKQYDAAIDAARKELA